MSWVVAVLDTVHDRLREAEAWDELRVLSRMSDDELVLLATQEVTDPQGSTAQVAA